MVGHLAIRQYAYNIRPEKFNFFGRFTSRPNVVSPFHALLGLSKYWLPFQKQAIYPAVSWETRGNESQRINKSMIGDQYLRKQSMSELAAVSPIIFLSR